jgi:CheY-like chemotaxis protein
MPRILIVDDNAAIRHLMRSYLEHAGHLICGEAHDGVQAIESAKQTQPDLVLLDLTMPVMSGIETASVLKRIMPQTPIILFTLHEDAINKELAATAGVDLVADKTSGIPKLGESIKTLLARSTSTRSPVTNSSSSATESSCNKNAPDARRKP